MNKEKKITTIESTIVILMWVIVFTTPLLFLDEFSTNWRAVHVMWAEYLVIAIVFVINRCILMPRLFFKKKYAKYSLYLATIFTLFILFIVRYDGINQTLSFFGADTISHISPKSNKGDINDDYEYLLENETDSSVWDSIIDNNSVQHGLGTILGRKDNVDQRPQQPTRSNYYENKREDIYKGYLNDYYDRFDTKQRPQPGRETPNDRADMRQRPQSMRNRDNNMSYTEHSQRYVRDSSYIAYNNIIQSTKDSFLEIYNNDENLAQSSLSRMIDSIDRISTEGYNPNILEHLYRKSGGSYNSLRNMPPQRMLFQTMSRLNTSPPNFRFIPPYINIIILAIIAIALDMGLSLAIKWLISEQRQAEMKKENISAQLSNLQNQISPHFFMNTLNNIHALVEIDPERAQKTIIELSGLMDYLIYESSNIETVSLQREIVFTESYVNLMRLRYPKRVSIEFSCNKSIPASIKIPPLLFLNFIENTFKYGVDYTKESFINIQFIFSDTNIEMLTENSNHADSIKKKEQHGLGQSNSHKRLKLLYGDNYSLKIVDTSDKYSVLLKVPILANEINESISSKRGEAKKSFQIAHNNY